MANQHRLERRATLLAGAIQRQLRIISTVVGPPGERPPFTRQLSAPDAMKWWREHRFDEMGLAMMSKLPVDKQLELDVALSRNIEEEQALPSMEV